MRANTKWTIAALVALAAVTVHTLHAQAIGPVSIAHDSDAAGSIHSKTYADGQGPLDPVVRNTLPSPEDSMGPDRRGASLPRLQPADIQRLG